MSTPFSTLISLEKHWPGLDPLRENEAEQKILEASIEIRASYPDIDARIRSGKLSADVVELVVNRMVRRAMNTPESIPENLTSLQSTVGPFSQNLSFSNTDGNIFLSSRDKQLLAGPKTKGKAWTIEVH